MPSTTYTGIVVSGATVVYGASAAPGATVGYGSTYDSTASLTIVTTAVNTKWMVEVDADINLGGSSAYYVAGLYLKAKVDGSYVATTGARWGGPTGTANLEPELTVRGRVVVTLAATGAHTIQASMNNASGDSRAVVTLNAVTLSATQLTS